MLLLSIAYNDRRHKTALYGKRLIKLKELGFEIENVGEYYGYKGVYNKYFFRIYYNPNSTLYKQTHSIVIMLYYKPERKANNEVNIERLNSLNKKYKRWEFSDPTDAHQVLFEEAYIQIQTRFTLFTTFNKLKYRIHQALEYAHEEKLLPISEKEVDKLIAESVYKHGPSIDTFWQSKDPLRM